MLLMDPQSLAFVIVLYLCKLFCLFTATAVLVGTGFCLESGKMAGSVAQCTLSIPLFPHVQAGAKLNYRASELLKSKVLRKDYNWHRANLSYGDVMPNVFAAFLKVGA